MEEIFEDAILDELFNTRRDGFECIYIKQYGKSKEIEEFEESEIRLEKIIKKIVKNKRKQKKILKFLEKYQNASIDEKWFWNKQYYKFAFIDGFHFKKEINEGKNIEENNLL